MKNLGCMIEIYKLCYLSGLKLRYTDHNIKFSGEGMCLKRQRPLNKGGVFYDNSKK